MRKNDQCPKTKKVKFIEANQENKKVIKEENINLNQSELNKKKKHIKNKKHLSHDKSLKIEKCNSIINDKIKKNNKSIKKNHTKFKRFSFLMILFIIPFTNSSNTVVNYDEETNSEYHQTNQRRIFLKFSEITLKLNQGNYPILSNNFFQRYKPYEIYINNSLQSTLNYIYKY